MSEKTKEILDKIVGKSIKNITKVTAEEEDGLTWDEVVIVFNDGSRLILKSWSKDKNISGIYFRYREK